MKETDMKKIVVAGAGAYHFAPAIFEDLFVKYRMPVEIWMVDADLDLAELSARGAQALAKCFNVEARFYYTTQLRKTLFSADAVIVCSDFLDDALWKMDYEALDEVGLGKQARLRGGLGGAMQTMRVLNFISDLAGAMQEDCNEGAPLILCESGYSGLPLARACECAQRMYGVRTLGLSGVTEQTRKRLAMYLEVKEPEMKIACAGLNGFSWVTEMTDKNGKDLIPRCMREMKEDYHEKLAAQYIDWYGAIPAGHRTTQFELLVDTEESPRRTVPPMSGVGLADSEVRKNELAKLTVYGPMRPEGLKAWGHMRTSGLNSVRPIEVLRALWGEGECSVESLCYPCDGAVPGVTLGRFVEGPAKITADGVQGIPTAMPIELEDVMEQLSLVNILYAQAGAEGDRRALREALEIDPALTGIDLLYAEGLLNEMMEKQKEFLPRFFEQESAVE